MTPKYPSKVAPKSPTRSTRPVSIDVFDPPLLREIRTALQLQHNFKLGGRLSADRQAAQKKVGELGKFILLVFGNSRGPLSEYLGSSDAVRVTQGEGYLELDFVCEESEDEEPGSLSVRVDYNVLLSADPIREQRLSDWNKRRAAAEEVLKKLDEEYAEINKQLESPRSYDFLSE